MQRSPDLSVPCLVPGLITRDECNCVPRIVSQKESCSSFSVLEIRVPGD